MRKGTKLSLLALGLALTCAGWWVVQMRQVDIPEDRTAFVIGFLAAAILGITALVRGAGWVGVGPACLAIFIGILLPFTIGVSPQEVASRAIQIGDTLPHFTSVEDSGETFDSNRLDGKLLLIKFFRAHW